MQACLKHFMGPIHVCLESKVCFRLDRCKCGWQRDQNIAISGFGTSMQMCVSYTWIWYNFSNMIWLWKIWYNIQTDFFLSEECRCTPNILNDSNSNKHTNTHIHKNKYTYTQNKYTNTNTKIHIIWVMPICVQCPQSL